MIPHSKPSLEPVDEEAVMDVLRSGQIAQGPMVARFEQQMGEFLGLQGGVAVNSGTMAIELALRALHIGEHDEVIVPSYVCSAPWQAITRVGARPVLADIDPETLNIDPASARLALTTKTRAILVPHLFGLPADLDALQQLGVPLIEDCAQTLGSTVGGQRVGSVGTLTVCSFYATKLLCAGEGGMVLSNDTTLLEHIRQFREYDERPVLTLGSSNLKMSDLHAALGCAQLRRLPEFISRRRRIAEAYNRALPINPAGQRLIGPTVPPNRTHVYFRYVLRVKSDAPSVEAADPADAWVARFHAAGLQARRPVFRPLHHYLGHKGFPASEDAYRTTLSIPIYPAMTEETLRRCLAIFREVCGEIDRD
ncbi:MAG: DegT/DnrJ/EryC1/StrS family aminotransferase [Nitrospiraceae bacterium]